MVQLLFEIGGLIWKRPMNTIYIYVVIAGKISMLKMSAKRFNRCRLRVFLIVSLDMERKTSRAGIPANS